MADEAQIRELVEKMHQERANLLALLRGLSEEEAERVPKTDAKGEAEWTAKEQMAHLCLMEASYRAWVEKALKEDNPDLTGVRGEPLPVSLENAHSHTVAALISVMSEQRAKTLELIGRLKPEDYDRTATSPAFGTLTVLQWLRSYYRHDRMHYSQISGQESEYRPRFLSGVEPDQRVGRST